MKPEEENKDGYMFSTSSILSALNLDEDKDAQVSPETTIQKDQAFASRCHETTPVTFLPCKKPARLLFEDINSNDYWNGMYNSTEFWTCLYCGDKFLIKALLKSHAGEHKDEKNFSMSQSCFDCGSYFHTFQEYTFHMQSTGHMSDNNNQSVSRNLNHRPGQYTGSVNSAPISQQQQQFRTGPSSTPRFNNQSSKFGVTFVSLYFGGMLKAENILGGCGWALIDESAMNETVITQGAAPITPHPHSAIPINAIRLEYESLLMGLAASLSVNVRRIKIKCTSDAVLRNISSGHFNAALVGRQQFHPVLEELNANAMRFLQKFEWIDYELITPEQNFFVNQITSTMLASLHKANLENRPPLISVDSFRNSGGGDNIHNSRGSESLQSSRGSTVAGGNSMEHHMLHASSGRPRNGAIVNCAPINVADRGGMPKKNNLPPPSIQIPPMSPYGKYPANNSSLASPFSPCTTTHSGSSSRGGFGDLTGLLSPADRMISGGGMSTLGGGNGAIGPQSPAAQMKSLMAQTPISKPSPLSPYSALLGGSDSGDYLSTAFPREHFEFDLADEYKPF